MAPIPWWCLGILKLGGQKKSKERDGERGGERGERREKFYNDVATIQFSAQAQLIYSAPSISDLLMKNDTDSVDAQ